MNRRTIVVGTAALALAAFGGASWYVTNPSAPTGDATASATTLGFDPAVLVRPHAPVLGPADAPVTIVEFFDPSCEACRAFHPVLKQIQREFPTQVRIVLRYAAFHEGSDEAVRILEAARQQNQFEPVLDALFEFQTTWAAHEGPQLEAAWKIAGHAGLNIEKGKAFRQFPGTVAILNIDAADVKAAGVEQTPTFFINGKPLVKFGAAELVEAVRAEVAVLKE